MRVRPWNTRPRVFVVGGIRNVDAFDGVLVGQKVGSELRYRGVVEWGDALFAS